MPQWGNRDFVSGNNKPKWANTSNVFGANTGEAQTANLLGKGVTQGWVQITHGTGYIIALGIANAGSNIQSPGRINLYGGGATTAANILFGINNISNTVNSFTIVSGGEGYLTMPVANVTKPPGAGFDAVFTPVMGGRFNRNTFETLVVVKGMTDDAENTEFPG